MHTVPNISATKRKPTTNLCSCAYYTHLRFESQSSHIVKQKVKVSRMYSEAVAKICHFKSIVAGCVRCIVLRGRSKWYLAWIYRLMLTPSVNTLTFYVTTCVRRTYGCSRLTKKTTLFHWMRRITRRTIESWPHHIPSKWQTIWCFDAKLRRTFGVWTPIWQTSTFTYSFDIAHFVSGYEESIC